MGGWMVAGVALGAFTVGICIGFLAGAYCAYLATKDDIDQARADAKRERERADNAVDSLARQMRGEPISLAAVARDAEAMEASLRESQETREMFLDETDDVPVDK